MLCSEWDGVKPDITILGACLFAGCSACHVKVGRQGCSCLMVLKPPCVWPPWLGTCPLAGCCVQPQSHPLAAAPQARHCREAPCPCQLCLPTTR